MGFEPVPKTGALDQLGHLDIIIIVVLEHKKRVSNKSPKLIIVSIKT